jgi:hypothetical protein
MVNYQNGIIYAIWYNEELFYIGSTTNFIERKAAHKKKINYNCEPQYPFHKTMNELNILFEDLRFEEYEKYSCNSKAELFKREGEIQRILKPKYNIRVSGQTEQERRIIRKDKHEMYNCECGSKCLLSVKARHLRSKTHIDFINGITKFEIIINK